MPMIEPCPQCGYPDMTVAHAATCLHCGVRVHAASPDPDDHLCRACLEKERLVRFMLRKALSLYDQALLAMPHDDMGGDADEARTLLMQALASLHALSSEAVKAHPTYCFWQNEIARMIEHVSPESEVNP